MGNKVVSTILFLILGPLYFLLLLNFALKTTAFNPEYLKKEFVAQSAYTKVIAGLNEVALKAETSPGEGIPTSEVAKAILENLNPSDFQTVVEMALDGKRGTEIQKTVYAKVETALKTKYDSLPICAAEMDTACRPSGVSFEDMGKSNFMGMPVNVNQALAQTKTVTVASEKTFNWRVYLPYFFTFILGLILLLLARLFAGSWKKNIFSNWTLSCNYRRLFLYKWLFSFKIFCPRIFKGVTNFKFGIFLSKLNCPAF